ncbi:MAG: GNAT family N-acetyltransferase [Cellulosilyticaceae bacterium]
MKIKLIKPTLAYGDDIMNYKEEFIESGESMAGCGNLRECASAKEWIDTLSIRENEDTCPEDKVPSTTYIAVRVCDDKIVGVIDIRHHINNPILSVWGGHIGYSVRPSERQKGYATEMLRQALTKCKVYGFDKVLVTCDHENIASKKTIIANGGGFDKEVSVDGEKIERYWIELEA